MNDIIQSQGLALNQASQYQMLAPNEYQQGNPTQLSPIESQTGDLSGVVDLAAAVDEKMQEKKQKQLETGLEKSKSMTPSLAKNSGADAGKITPKADSVMSGNGMNGLIGSLGLGKTLENSPLKNTIGGQILGGGADKAMGSTIGGKLLGIGGGDGGSNAGGGAWSKISGLLGKL